MANLGVVGKSASGGRSTSFKGTVAPGLIKHDRPKKGVGGVSLSTRPTDGQIWPRRY